MSRSWLDINRIHDDSLCALNYANAFDLQHGNVVHRCSGTARLPFITWPVRSSAHQQMPLSHCNFSKLPLGKQCNVLSARPSLTAAALRRLHSVETKRNENNLTNFIHRNVRLTACHVIVCIVAAPIPAVNALARFAVAKASESGRAWSGLIGFTIEINLNRQSDTDTCHKSYRLCIA